MTKNFIEFTANKDERGNLFKISCPGRNQATAIYVENTLSAEDIIDTKEFIDSLSAFIEGAHIVLRPFSEEGWKEQAPKHLTGIAAGTRSLQQSAMARSKDLGKRYAEWLTPPKTVSPERLAEMRSHLRGLKSSTAMHLVMQDGLIALAALQAPEGIAGMNDPGIINQVKRTAAMHTLKEWRAGQMTVKPTPANPLAQGRDEEALNVYAESAIKRHENAREAVKAVEAIIGQAVNFYAVAADISPEQAFEAMELGK